MSDNRAEEDKEWGADEINEDRRCGRTGIMPRRYADYQGRDQRRGIPKTPEATPSLILALYMILFQEN